MPRRSRALSDELHLFDKGEVFDVEFLVRRDWFSNAMVAKKAKIKCVDAGIAAKSGWKVLGSDGGSTL
jgi:hypothetical protein